MAKRPLGAQISHALKARGVDVIFGIPGVHNVELYRGINEGRYHPCAGPPRAGCGVHGGWLCARHRRGRVLPMSLPGRA